MKSQRTVTLETDRICKAVKEQNLQKHSIMKRFMLFFCLMCTQSGKTEELTRLLAA